MIVAKTSGTGTKGGVEFGEQYGLYELLSAGPVTAREVADWGGLPETTIAGWLDAQAADGYVVRDQAGRYRCWSFIDKAR